MQRRYYQQEAVNSIYQYFQSNSGNPIVAMPTGTGKSVVIADFIREVFTYFPNQRVMMLTHVKELIEQNFKTQLNIWPTAPAGIYSAGLNKRETYYPITFAGIGSVVNKPLLFGHIDLILVDECHLVSPNANTMYRHLIAELRYKNPHLKVIGFSATPFRRGLGLLTDGGLFTDICYDITGKDPFNKLIKEGYLMNLIPQRTDLTLDTSNVRIQGGEFVQKDLQLAVDKQEITHRALDEMAVQAEDRNHWLIFASGIEHSDHIAERLCQMGIEAASVHSKVKNRDELIKKFKAGDIKAIVNNNILTTGFDSPHIDYIGMLRPTTSAGLWVQMLGRGTRPNYADLGLDLEIEENRLAAIAASAKQNCLVSDFAGNTRRLGPINDPVLPMRRTKRKGQAPVKLCDHCNTYNHASVRHCIYCGEEFPFKIKIEAKSSRNELIADGNPQVEMFHVERVTYRRHLKEGRPDSIKVSYYCGMRLFHEWVCFEHPGFAGKKARDWWRERSPDDPPETTDEALQLLDDLPVPSAIRVWINKKYPEIMSYDFNKQAYYEAAVEEEAPF